MSDRSSMKQQEILDSIVIGQSPLTGEVYLYLLDKSGKPKCKSKFTDRLKAFAPQLFPEKE